MGEEAGGKTTDIMNKNRIQGRRWLGKGAMDSDARYSLRSRRGKFGVACREALSLIPGGPRVRQQWLRALRSDRTDPAGVSRGRSSGSEPLTAKAQTERQ